MLIKLKWPDIENYDVMAVSHSFYAFICRIPRAGSTDLIILTMIENFQSLFYPLFVPSQKLILLLSISLGFSVSMETPALFHLEHVLQDQV